MQYVSVIVGINHQDVDRVFDYRVPENLLAQVQIGQRIIVPFGKGNKKTEGTILSSMEETEVPIGKIKDILEILDDGIPMFTPVMLELAQWMKDAYYCTLSQCMQTIMPSGIRTRTTWWITKIQSDEKMQALSQREEELLAFLATQGDGADISVLEAEFTGNIRATIKRLEEKNAVRISQKVFRSDYKKEQNFYRLDKLHPLLEPTYEKAIRSKNLQGQRDVLEYLWDRDEVVGEQLREDTGVSTSPIKTLVAKGIVLEERKTVKRDVLNTTVIPQSQAFVPTPAQANVLAQIEEEGQKDQMKPILLHGVTGSGKTEIYMQLIEKVIRDGKQAIVLVPEISLTPQMMHRFVSRFGDLVSFTHSRLSLGERLDQWRKARDGDISIMIGPRSAVFAPFSNLGAIIMDEFHEYSYVSETTPKYDAKEVATWLAERCHALLVMGSATPDVASFYRAKQGEYLLLQLKERTGGGQLPQTQKIDMRLELEEGNRSVFSCELQSAIRQNLKDGEQTMLFLNRRGYATFVSCRACGHVMTCPDCNLAYTYHEKGNYLMCHYCGKTEANPKVCPACQSKHIRYFGTGTQKIEDETRKLFPSARILRMDLDTTTRKHSHAQILEIFGRGDADILIGTQMIAKGHDFPNVSLVGILAADLSLHVGGYQAGERTFQLILQAGGRAGRSETLGNVLIQTYQPDNYCVDFAARQDYEGFYEQEILLREAMEYPPFATVASIMVSGKDEDETKDAVEVLHGKVCAGKIDDMEVFDPMQAGIYKFKGEFRWHIMVKGAVQRQTMDWVAECIRQTEREKKRNVRYNLTCNPIHME